MLHSPVEQKYFDKEFVVYVLIFRTQERPVFSILIEQILHKNYTVSQQEFTIWVIDTFATTDYGRMMAQFQTLCSLNSYPNPK